MPRKYGWVNREGSGGSEEQNARRIVEIVYRKATITARRIHGLEARERRGDNNNQHRELQTNFSRAGGVGGVGGEGSARTTHAHAKNSRNSPFYNIEQTCRILAANLNHCSVATPLPPPPCRRPTSRHSLIR